MTFKKNQEVKFRTRGDRPRMAGKVKKVYDTARGKFVKILGTDGVERNVRPCYVG